MDLKILFSDKKFFLATLVLLFCSFFIYKSLFFISPNTSPVFPDTFPDRISKWHGENVDYDKEVLASLDTDKTIYKTFYSKGYPPITLFMGCYNTLEKADLSHSPVVCFTGQGWEITGNGFKNIPFDQSNLESIKVNQTIQHKSDKNLITFYWYQTQRRAFTNRGFLKLSLFFHKLLGQSDKNAFVRLTVIVPKKMTLDIGSGYLSEFVKKMYPHMKNYFL